VPVGAEVQGLLAASLGRTSPALSSHAIYRTDNKNVIGDAVAQGGRGSLQGSMGRLLAQFVGRH
jgi:hypothetical protein